MSLETLICSDRRPPEHAPSISLQADCKSCKGLCCVLLPFDADQGFAFDKPAGKPCANLTRQFRCAVHHTLVEAGFPGCRLYDCHGAGQYVSKLLDLDDAWHESETSVREAYEAFRVIRTLHVRLKARRAQLSAG